MNFDYRFKISLKYSIERIYLPIRKQNKNCINVLSVKLIYSRVNNNCTYIKITKLKKNKSLYCT